MVDKLIFQTVFFFKEDHHFFLYLRTRHKPSQSINNDWKLQIILTEMFELQLVLDM